MKIKELKLERYLYLYRRNIELYSSLARSFYMLTPHPSFMDAIKHIESLFMRERKNMLKTIDNMENKTPEAKYLERECEGVVIDFGRLKDRMKMISEENEHKEDKL